MEHAQEILVIIVSSVLPLFLFVEIVVLILVPKLVSAAKRAVLMAEHVIQSAEAATSVIKNAGGPLAFFKIIRNLMQLAEKFRK